MITDVLTTNSLSLATTATAPPSSKQTIIDKNQHSPATSVDIENPTSPAGPETTSTDNTITNPSKKPANESPEDFSLTLHKKIEPQKTRKSQENTKNEAKSSIFDTKTAVHAEQAKSLKALNMAVTLDGNVPTTIENPGLNKIATAPGEKAQQVITSLIQNTTLEAPQGPNSTTAKLSQTTSQTSKTENIPVLNSEQGQKGIKDILSNLTKATDGIDINQGNSKNTDLALILNKSTGETTDIPIQKNGQKLMNTAVPVNDKTITVDEKRAIPNETPVSNAVSNAQKNPILNTSPLTIQSNRSDAQSKPADTATTNTEDPTNNKALATKILSEFSSSSDNESQPIWKNLSGEGTIGKLNLTKIQFSTAQTKNHSNSTLEDSTNSNFEQLLPQINAPSHITEPISTYAETVKSDGGTSPGSASIKISQQIIETVQSSISQQTGNQKITISLNPPELGKVFIKFEEQDNQITGLLEVSKTQTRYEVEQALPEIIRSIQNSGVQIKRLDVVLTNQSGQEPSKNLSHDSFFQQHGFAEGGNPDNPDATATGPGQWLFNDSNYQDNLEPQKMVITDNRINLLM